MQKGKGGGKKPPTDGSGCWTCGGQHIQSECPKGGDRQIRAIEERTDTNAWGEQWISLLALLTEIKKKQNKRVTAPTTEGKGWTTMPEEQEEEHQEHARLLRGHLRAPGGTHADCSTVSRLSVPRAEKGGTCTIRRRDNGQIGQKRSRRRSTRYKRGCSAASCVHLRAQGSWRRRPTLSARAGARSTMTM